MTESCRTYPPEPAPSKLRNIDVMLDHGCRRNLFRQRIKIGEARKCINMAHVCAPWRPLSSPLLMLNTAVRRGRFLDRKSIICMSATTLMPSSVAPGAVETESKWAENSTASSIYKLGKNPTLTSTKHLLSAIVYAVDDYENVVSFGV